MNKRKDNQLSNRARIYQLQEALSNLQVGFNALLEKLSNRDQEVTLYLAAIPVALADAFPHDFSEGGKPRNIYLEHLQRVVKAHEEASKNIDETRKGITLMTIGDAANANT